MLVIMCVVTFSSLQTSNYILEIRFERKLYNTPNKTTISSCEMTTIHGEETSPLEDLTRNLAEYVQTLSRYFRSTGYVQPSFDKNTPTVVLPENASPQAHFAREHIMDCAMKIFQLSAGPSEYLANMQVGVSIFFTVKV